MSYATFEYPVFYLVIPPWGTLKPFQGVLEVKTIFITLRLVFTVWTFALMVQNQ